MEIQNVYIMVGIPGSGKSTWVKQHLNKEFELAFSSDMYREKLCGNASDQTKNKQVFCTLYQDMKDALMEGKSICFDATNVTLKDRAKFVNLCREVNKEIRIHAVYLSINKADAVVRDKKRARVVGEEVIDKFIKRLVEPKLDEGFSSITQIYNSRYIPNK